MSLPGNQWIDSNIGDPRDGRRGAVRGDNIIARAITPNDWPLIEALFGRDGAVRVLSVLVCGALFSGVIVRSVGGA